MFCVFWEAEKQSELVQSVCSQLQRQWRRERLHKVDDWRKNSTWASLSAHYQHTSIHSSIILPTSALMVLQRSAGAHPSASRSHSHLRANYDLHSCVSFTLGGNQNTWWPSTQGEAADPTEQALSPTGSRTRGLAECSKKYVFTLPFYNLCVYKVKSVTHLVSFIHHLILWNILWTGQQFSIELI